MSEIPKLIHNVWFGDEAPPEHEFRFAASWKQHHADHRLIMWADHPELFKTGPWDDVQAVPRFTQHDMIGPCMAWTEQYTNTAQGALSDVMRLQLIEEHGGIYVDTDCLCLRNVRELLDPQRVTMSEENNGAGCGNFFIASPPRHPVIHQVQRAIADRGREATLGTRWVSVLELTGPRVIDPVMNRCADAGGAAILPYHRLSPWHPMFEFPVNDWSSVEWPEGAYGCHLYSAKWTHIRRKQMVKEPERQDPFGCEWIWKGLPPKIKKSLLRELPTDTTDFR